MCSVRYEILDMMRSLKDGSPKNEDTVIIHLTLIVLNLYDVFFLLNIKEDTLKNDSNQFLVSIDSN